MPKWNDARRSEDAVVEVTESQLRVDTKTDHLPIPAIYSIVHFSCVLSFSLRARSHDVSALMFRFPY